MEYYFKMDVKNMRKSCGLHLFISEHGQGAGCCEQGNKNLYCYTVYFEDSPMIKNQQMH
jgi:hypothetical protein